MRENAIHMPCAPSEFVAISFYPESHPSSLDDSQQKDRWYLCTAGERWITYWENVTTTPIVVTTPYNSSAPGVIDYRSKYDERSQSFVCKFIISAAELNKDKNKLVDFPETKESSGKYLVKFLAFTSALLYCLSDLSSGTPVKIKLAQGRVLRTILSQNKITSSLAKKKGVKTAIEQALEQKYFRAQQNLEMP